MDRQALGTATIIRANALDLPLDDNSVDLVVTSPPYFGLRSYQDNGAHYDGQIGAEPTPTEFVDALLAVTAEAARVLKPTGSLWVNLGDSYARTGGGGAGSSDGKTGRNKGGRPATKTPPGIREKSLIGIPWRYALRCIDELGLILRAEVVWNKPNGLPESVTDRVRRSHETWFHFTLEPRYYADLDPIRQPHATASVARAGRARLTAYDAPGSTPNKRDETPPNPLGALPPSVWEVPTEPLRVPAELGVDHFAAYPTEWPRRIIAAWCPPGGTVLDPFGGTGTTALVAKALGRHGVSVDLSADYCRLAEWRTNDRDQLAKVLGIAKAEQQPADQLDLFAEFADTP